MSDLFIYKKQLLGLLVLMILLVPYFSVSASSDLASVWADQYRVDPYQPPITVDTKALGKFAEFLVYLVFAILGLFAFASIFIGRLKMFLAGSSEDDYDSAKSTFITAIIAFILILGVFVSLDYIFILVEQWSARMA